MPEEKTTDKSEQTKRKYTKKSDLIGHQAQPTVLNTKPKLDVDTERILTDNLIMAGLAGKVDMSELDKFTRISDARDVIYQQIDIMCQDATVSSVVRTYTEDVCETADNGHIVWAESADPKISKHINYLLNVANVDKNIYGWAYNLIKYGDIYLQMCRESDLEDQLFAGSKLRSGRLNEGVYVNTHNASDRYSY